MNSKNNGKMIIGILIMVVVAISIIGVTYAYFVASFTRNSTDSITITAGELIANYTHGQSLSVSNVVPGWVSDGLHYYDVDVAARNGGKIYATLAGYADNKVEPEAKATATNGIAQPISFSVTKSNRSAGDVSFIIRLNVEQNGIYDAWNGITSAKTVLTSADGTALADDDARLTEYNKAVASKDLKANYDNDRGNLYVALYEGEFVLGAGPENNFGTGNTLVGGPYVLADTGVQQILVTSPITITDDTEKKYFVMFKYENETDAEQKAQAITIKASANIIGVQKDNTATYTYTTATADGTGIITATDMIVPNVADTVTVSNTGTDLTFGNADSDDDATIYYGSVNADTGSAAVAAAKNTKFGTFKTDYAAMTVWYDADNAPVIWPVSTDKVNVAFTESSTLYSNALAD